MTIYNRRSEPNDAENASSEQNEKLSPAGCNIKRINFEKYQKLSSKIGWSQLIYRFKREWSSFEKIPINAFSANLKNRQSCVSQHFHQQNSSEQIKQV